MESLLLLFHGSPFALTGLFALLILCGIGLPMPEDVILLGAGMVAAESGHSWAPVSVLMYFGVLAGDSLVFGVGRRFGCRVLTLMRAYNWVSRAKQDKIERLFQRHGAAAFFLARFMPGLRAPFFCTAGAMKARYAQFVLFDGLAALVSVPAFVWLGRYLWLRFGDDIGKFTGVVSRTHTYTLLASAGVLIAIAFAVWLNRAKFNRGAQ